MAGQSGLPHAADAVGRAHPTPLLTDLPADVSVREMTDADWYAVLRIYGEGSATGNATFATEVPEPRNLGRSMA